MGRQIPIKNLLCVFEYIIQVRYRFDLNYMKIGCQVPAITKKGLFIKSMSIKIAHK